MKKVEINWDLFWKKFNSWYDDSNEPSWEDQKNHIESLIEEQLLARYLES